MNGPIHFYKYQGTGNDFVILDGYDVEAPILSENQISAICDRRFGVGADGLIIITKVPGYDFQMIYFNADGRESTMCGNGGRCAVLFAWHRKWISAKTRFIAIDGPHDGKVHADGRISLGMRDVNLIEVHESGLFLDTGSPHLVCFQTDVNELNVQVTGAQIRKSPPFAQTGVNVNFAEELAPGTLFARTYERGVEAETLSCGTGVTAVALAYAHNQTEPHDQITVETPGGQLSVSFQKTDEGYKEIWLTGPAEAVFEGTIHKPC
jgi:diaminopimelate epimerase